MKAVSELIQGVLRSNSLNLEVEPDVESGSAVSIACRDTGSLGMAERVANQCLCHQRCAILALRLGQGISATNHRAADSFREFDFRSAFGVARIAVQGDAPCGAQGFRDRLGLLRFPLSGRQSRRFGSGWGLKVKGYDERAGDYRQKPCGKNGSGANSGT
jgi:hypothetical protein